MVLTNADTRQIIAAGKPLLLEHGQLAMALDNLQKKVLAYSAVNAALSQNDDGKEFDTKGSDEAPGGDLLDVFSKYYEGDWRGDGGEHHDTSELLRLYQRLRAIESGQAAGRNVRWHVRE
jgi:hypothetical protein